MLLLLFHGVWLGRIQSRFPGQNIARALPLLISGGPRGSRAQFWRRLHESSIQSFLCMPRLIDFLFWKKDCRIISHANSVCSPVYVELQNTFKISKKFLILMKSECGLDSSHWNLPIVPFCDNISVLILVFSLLVIFVCRSF